MNIDITYLLFVLVAIVLSMTLHEAMHAFTSNWLGDDTAKLQGRLTLNPISHIDPVMTIALPLILAALGAPPFGAAKPVPFNPARVKWDEFGAALVGLAGPFTNLVLGFVAFLIASALGVTQFSTLGLFLQVFILVNLAFFVFNMLPIPPLDGSRALYAIAPDSIRRGMEALEQYGILLVFAIVFLFNAQLGLFMTRSIDAILTLFTRLTGN
ncbi:zinc metalloprotease ywhC [Candidatus Saccharibacteria bacterium]|nr:MAG: zinc metalloprotease ywhC [Candidatus Saccharibacteria bacterium]